MSSRKNTPGDADPRPWRSKALRSLINGEYVRLPDNVRAMLDEALWGAEVYGLASGPVEAWEFLAVTGINSIRDSLDYSEDGVATPEKDFRHAVLCRDNWECKMCGSSKALEVHHIIPRSICRQRGWEHLLVDPRNGISLCGSFSYNDKNTVGCHVKITPKWRKHVAPFMAISWPELDLNGSSLEMRHLLEGSE